MNAEHNIKPITKSTTLGDLFLDVLEQNAKQRNNIYDKTE